MSTKLQQIRRHNEWKMNISPIVNVLEFKWFELVAIYESISCLAYWAKSSSAIFYTAGNVLFFNN